MKLIIIRHGDPDYSIDSLTEKGWREAEYLCDRISKLDVKAFYVSPLGRAKDTASFTLKKMNRTATECEWLREFDARIHRPDRPDIEKIPWDWLPQDWTADERFFDYRTWYENEVMQAGNVKKEYDSEKIWNKKTKPYWKSTICLFLSGCMTEPWNRKICRSFPICT